MLDGHSTHACKPIAGMHPSHAELFKVGAQVQPYKDCLNIDVCVSCACVPVPTSSFFARVVCLHCGVLRAVEHLQAQSKAKAVLLMRCAVGVLPIVGH